MQPVVQPAKTDSDIKRCFTVMQQLRPHLSEAAFIEQTKRQLQNGYNLVYLSDPNAVAAAAGYRTLEFLAWGKVFYIDDLITDHQARKKGYGKQLLQWLLEEAKRQGCDQVHLDSGAARHDAHRLYLNHGLKLNCYHFALDLKGSGN